MIQSTSLSVLHFNQPNQTLKCLESIRCAGVRPNRVFVYDNGSLPRNAEMVRDAFPEYRHSGNKDNFGYSGGFNRALSAAFGSGFDGALFLTNDTRIEPETLSSIEKFVKDKRAEFIAPRIVYESDPSAVDSLGGFFDPEKLSLGHYKDLNLPELLNPGTDYVPGTALWVSRNVFEKLGGMDESFHTYWEDADFSFRAHHSGISIHRCASAVIRHGVGKTCHDKALYTAFFYQRNRIRFCRKYLPENEWTLAKERIRADLEQYGKRWKEKNDSVRMGYLDDLFRELG